MTGDDGESPVGDVPRGDILTALADASDDIICLFTADWDRILFISEAYEDIVGHPIEAFRDDPTDLIEGVHPDDRETVREWMDAVSAGEQAEVEIRVNPAEDYDRWLRIQTEPLGTDDSPTRVAGFGQEITERKQRKQELQTIRQELEAANEELQQLAYVASHDLQEPLRMVSSYMSLLETEYSDELDEDAQEYIEFAVDGADRMKAMVEGLLEFSRVETRGGDIEPVDAEEVLEGVRQGLALQIEETNATVDVDALPTVPADRGQLSRVFQNLVGNALQYSGDEPPDVRIRCEERPDEYVFEVEDEGVGIPEEKHEQMFEIFQRGADAAGERTGIGLAIAQRIVERHDGDMWIESAEGGGTTVYFSLSKEPERTA